MILILFNLFTAAKIFSQDTPPRSGFPKDKDLFGGSLFIYETVIFKSHQDEQKSRLDIYVAFANDLLQFVKERNGDFLADYEIFASIYDNKNNLIDEASEAKKILVTEFIKTNDRQLNNRHKFSFELQPGDYKLVLNLTDHDTQINLRRDAGIEVKPHQDNKLFLSDIIFGDSLQLSPTAEIQKFVINLSRKFINPDSSFWAYFEIYPGNLTDTLKLFYSLVNENSEVIFEETTHFLPKDKIIFYLIELSRLINISGHYTLMVTVTQENSFSQKAKFSAIWRNSEFAKMNIDLAIKTMREYLSNQEYKLWTDASDSAKRALYQEYWAKRDPTPGTKRNELLIEFNRRIEFANNNFAVYSMRLDGWETDRGKIYLKYGQPSDVERNVKQINIPPYEIWYYQKLQRRFIFEDKSGTGEFKLVRIE